MDRHQKTQIEFSKYRTPELVQTIAETIGIPGAFRSITKWAFYGLIGLMLLVGGFLYITGNLKIFWTAAFEMYAIPTGLIGGLALGIAEFIRRSLGNMTKLVNLLMELTKQIAIDSGGLLSGGKTMPSTRDLIDDVYHQVILVTLKEAVGQIFGWLGRPVYWLYHLTLNQFVRAAIRMIPQADTEASQSLASAMEDVAENESVIISSLQWSQDKLNAVGGWLKLLVMIPCYCILAVVFAIILLPIILVWLFLFSGAPTPEPVDVVLLVSFWRDQLLHF